LGFLLGSFEGFQKHTYEFIPTNMGICLYILYIYILCWEWVKAVMFTCN
jgi:hypothetical protein